MKDSVTDPATHTDSTSATAIARDHLTASRERADVREQVGRGPMGTLDLDEAEQRHLAPPSRITELRERHAGRSIELPAVVSFSAGREPVAADPGPTAVRPHADVRFASPHRAMSLVHALFEWRADRLWCRDLRSTNGTRADGAPMHDWFPISNGMLLEFGDVAVRALDWRHARLCHPLAWCLGLSATCAIDRVLDVLRRDGPLLLLGPRGCDQEWLARQIHEASARREHPFVAFTKRLRPLQEHPLAGTRLGTVFVDVGTVGKVSSRFARALFADDDRLGSVRPILAAADIEQVRRAFGDLTQVSVLRLAPLATRREDVVPLLNWLMAQHGSPHRLEELGSAWIERLQAHHWSRNLYELRETERRLRALLESGNRRDAAKRLGSSRQALEKFLSRLFDEV
ncbi:MAG: FHA domain-containing protein [Kofleriaceae bacterium]|nr:MAG: FHA domain-containing protein [Kofleriaceae bacterium]